MPSDLPKPSSWKSVLYPHAWLGHIDIIDRIARSLGYPFYAWNGFVYSTDTGLKVGTFEECGLCT